MKLKKIIVSLFVVACVSCGSTLFDPHYPDPNVWRMDDMFCWYNDPDAKQWVTKGWNGDCPENTHYSSVPPTLDEFLVE